MRKLVKLLQLIVQGTSLRALIGSPDSPQLCKTLAGGSITSQKRLATAKQSSRMGDSELSLDSRFTNHASADARMLRYSWVNLPWGLAAESESRVFSARFSRRTGCLFAGLALFSFGGYAF